MHRKNITKYLFLVMISMIFFAFSSCEKDPIDKFVDLQIEKAYEEFGPQENIDNAEVQKDKVISIECPASIGPNEVCITGIVSNFLFSTDGFSGIEINPIFEARIGTNVSVSDSNSGYVIVSFNDPGDPYCLGISDVQSFIVGDSMISYGEFSSENSGHMDAYGHELVIQICSSDKYFSRVIDARQQGSSADETVDSNKTLETDETIPEIISQVEETEEISLSQEQQPCSEPMFRVGDILKLRDDEISDVIRSTPDIADGSDNIIFYIHPGHELLIIAGPICSQSENMWLVEGSDGISGWLQEAYGGQPLYEFVPPPDAIEEEPSPNNSKEYDAHHPFPDCPVSYLRIGYEVYVAYGGGPNNLRSSPIVSSSADNIIGLIEEGEWVYIIDGPKCSNGYLLWKVEKENGEEGWTAEVYNDDYWLLSE